MESEACTNFAALRLWSAALGDAIPPCDVCDSDSVLRLIPAFAGRSDAPATLLAGLLLAADLRPDDRIWLEGGAPDWLNLALGFTAGLAPGAEAASVWIGATVPDPLPSGIRRIILTEGRGQAAPAGPTLTCAADWG
ncbi:MAG TPA: hypothetical protein VL752_18110 [Acidisoma sp.]|uniref:hypothetical protein n=1 Tax=Acidisoma sp. TaxID=1872115 RepID=UPI002B7AA877|nr:hypothetical protein [Acidisoma sp.]HTI02867.1 hypothetical protein [Acidisoma sp.]